MSQSLASSCIIVCINHPTFHYSISISLKQITCSCLDVEY